MKIVVQSVLWIGIYLLAVTAPLLLLMLQPRPPGGGFWWDYSVAAGFSALAMLGVQFVMTARFRRMSAPFGIDIVYYFHRYMALFAVLLVLGHYALFKLLYPQALGPANPLQASLAMSAGRTSLLCLLLLAVSSVWRKQLGLQYEVWRIAHVLLSVAALILAVVHIEGMNHYSRQPAFAWFWLLFLVVFLALVIYVRVIKPLNMLRRPYKVVSVSPLTDKTCSLVLEPVGHPGLRFSAGQFAWLTLRASPFAFREHPFSIASSAQSPGRLEFAIKALGDFTSGIKAIRPGETAWVDGPYGAFCIDRVQTPGVVFIAGGVGIAPIISMLRTMAERGDRRPVWLIDANRAIESVIFQPELEALRDQLHLRLVWVLQEPAVGFQAQPGMITAELLDRVLPSNRCELHYFVCGPTPMLKVTERALHELGVPMKRVHAELFDLV